MGTAPAPSPTQHSPTAKCSGPGPQRPGRAFLCQPFCLNARTAFPTWANCTPYWSRGVTATWPFRVPSVGTTPHTQCTVPSTLIRSTNTCCTTEQTQYPKSMAPLTACPQNYPQVQKLSWECLCLGNLNIPGESDPSRAHRAPHSRQVQPVPTGLQAIRTPGRAGIGHPTRHSCHPCVSQPVLQAHLLFKTVLPISARLSPPSGVLASSCLHPSDGPPATTLLSTKLHPVPSLNWVL